MGVKSPPSDGPRADTRTSNKALTPWAPPGVPAPPKVPKGGLGMHAQHDLVGRDQKGKSVTATGCGY